VEPSTTEDETTESSTVESEEATSQEATQEQEQPVEPPFHEHPRWQQMQEEKARMAEEVAYLKGQQEARPGIPEVDPYAGQDPQTKVFYQDLDKRTNQAIEKAVQQERQQYQATLNALASQNAKIQEKLFRQDETDVKPNSPEENEIAVLIGQGVDPNKAAWAVMGPKRVESAKGAQKVATKSKTQQKAQANLETSGVPINSGLPSGEKIDFRADLDRRARELGI